jgi:hypothetical protein
MSQVNTVTSVQVGEPGILKELTSSDKTDADAHQQVAACAGILSESLPTTVDGSDAGRILLGVPEGRSDKFAAEDQLFALEEFNDEDSLSRDHSVRTAPVFTRDALSIVGEIGLPQRAMYGRVISQHAPGFPTELSDPKVYINTNAPFSALICGVQVRQCYSI